MHKIGEKNSCTYIYYIFNEKKIFPFQTEIIHALQKSTYCCLIPALLEAHLQTHYYIIYYLVIPQIKLYVMSFSEKNVCRFTFTFETNCSVYVVVHLAIQNDVVGVPFTCMLFYGWKFHINWDEDASFECIGSWCSSREVMCEPYRSWNDACNLLRMNVDKAVYNKALICHGLRHISLYTVQQRGHKMPPSDRLTPLHNQ